MRLIERSLFHVERIVQDVDGQRPIRRIRGGRHRRSVETLGLQVHPADSSRFQLRVAQSGNWRMERNHPRIARRGSLKYIRAEAIIAIFDNG